MEDEDEEAVSQVADCKGTHAAQCIHKAARQLPNLLRSIEVDCKGVTHKLPSDPSNRTSAAQTCLVVFWIVPKQVGVSGAPASAGEAWVDSRLAVPASSTFSKAAGWGTMPQIC